MKTSAYLALAAFCFHFSIAYAGSDSWTATGSGLWRVATNWSASQVPSSSFDPTTIGNAGTKTVTVDAATPAANLSLQGLTISAPNGSTNTLLLANLTSPFSTSRPLSVGAGGVLRVTNSSVSVRDTFDITAGNLIIDSGLLDTTLNLVDVRLGRSSGATGTAFLNGGTLKCFGFRVGELSGSQGACTINGGTLLCSSVVSMGEQLNSPGSMTILSGQLIATNDITKVGNLAPGTFTQSGGSSQLAFLSIGDNFPGTMNMSGGLLTVTPNNPAVDVTRVGNFGDSQFNISGGTVWLHGDFHVADNPGVTGNVVLSGGVLSATNGLVAIGRYGIGSMTVTNATAYFTNASVGRHDGSTGSFDIQTGGSVFSIDDFSIGRFSNSVGHVTITGGLLSLPGFNIWAGRDGAGDLTVSSGNVVAQGLFVGMSEFGTNAPQGTVTLNGGVVALSSNLVIGTDLISTGQVSMAGGTLAITNSGSAVLRVAAGGFNLNSGNVSADNLIITNGGGSFNFAGGTLQLGGLVVSNGSPFVVGDGADTATLQLLGGTYTFANGLVISANATVSGCGTIIGTIVTNGVMNLTCGASAPTVIQSVEKTGATVSIQVPTVTGKTYNLEFKNALTDPTWTPIVPGVGGDGTVINLLDSSATNGSRFYRVHVQ
jgi:hypothetical protein